MKGCCQNSCKPESPITRKVSSWLEKKLWIWRHDSRERALPVLLHQNTPAYARGGIRQVAPSGKKWLLAAPLGETFGTHGATTTLGSSNFVYSYEMLAWASWHNTPHTHTPHILIGQNLGKLAGNRTKKHIELWVIGSTVHTLNVWLDLKLTIMLNETILRNIYNQIIESRVNVVFHSKF